MMDAAGPGAIVRIWSANPAGTIRIYLDGAAQPVIEAPMSTLLGGKFPGLARPIAGEYSKGWNLYFPLPYAKSCKVTSDQGNFYYHVNYRTYAAGTAVESFKADLIQSRAEADAIPSLADRVAKLGAVLAEGTLPFERLTVIANPDEEIGSPLVRRPTAAIVLNPPSFDRYEPVMQPGGALIVNASLISSVSKRGDIRAIAIQANEIATELGAAQMANVVLVGALVAATGVVKLETLDAVLEEHVSARHRDKLELNKQALRRGAALVVGAATPDTVAA